MHGRFRTVEHERRYTWSVAGKMPVARRVLTTVLFTDIVGSTAHLARLGDRAWSDLVDGHHALFRRALAVAGGCEVDAAGDGFLATFDSPSRGVGCAQELVEGVRELGLEVRAGLHTGECELVGGRVRGLAVHIGARVAAAARASEVLVSGTVRDLLEGGDVVLEDRGLHELRGIAGVRRLFAVVPTRAERARVRPSSRNAAGVSRRSRRPTVLALHDGAETS
jgi:class 3 adenylate cyclase